MEGRYVILFGRIDMKISITKRAGNLADSFHSSLTNMTSGKINSLIMLCVSLIILCIAVMLWISTE